MKGPAEMCESEVNGQPNMSSSNSRTSNQPVDFSEYMWMADEELEDFDKKCEHELWEEFLMEQAYEDMLAEEDDTQTQFFQPHVEGQPRPTGPRHPHRNPNGRMYSSNQNCGPQQRHRYPPPAAAAAAAALNVDMSGLNINPGIAHQGPPPSGAVQNVPSYQILQRPSLGISAAPSSSSSHNPQGHVSGATSLNPNAPVFTPRCFGPSQTVVTSQAATGGQNHGEAAER